MKYYEQLTKPMIQDKKNKGWGKDRCITYYNKKLKVISPEVIDNLVNAIYAI